MCYRSPYYYSYDNLKKGMMCWFQWFPCVVSFPCSFTNERIEVAVHSKMSLLVWLRFLMVEMLLLLREISREITMKPLKYFPVKWQWKVFFRQCSMYQPGSTNTMWQSHDAYIQLITTVVQTLPKASELFYANSMHCGSFWFFCILKSLYVLSFFLHRMKFNHSFLRLVAPDKRHKRFGLISCSYLVWIQCFHLYVLFCSVSFGRWL